ncbi:hypothetical protein CSUNSWCD_57 [Campylobacter showae CSUNSWCD]|uniref:Uncharacterized protein n=1 Tax=Campylobacter showae CSUNSWCD TaxID=1244083 RepID=M5IHT7_9BACT|nr:hypothetical protein CSUNSWCD_57 [Campylobacter showae CSUNSWCD]
MAIQSKKRAKHHSLARKKQIFYLKSRKICSGARDKAAPRNFILKARRL